MSYCLQLVGMSRFFPRVDSSCFFSDNISPPPKNVALDYIMQDRTPEGLTGPSYTKIILFISHGVYDNLYDDLCHTGCCNINIVSRTSSYMPISKLGYKCL
jgi:hypothetical protein